MLDEDGNLCDTEFRFRIEQSYSSTRSETVSTCSRSEFDVALRHFFKILFLDAFANWRAFGQGAESMESSQRMQLAYLLW